MANTGISPDLESLIAAAATKHGLPLVLVRAMVLHESVGGITCAARYEPSFYERYEKDSTPSFRPDGCSIETERIQRSTSWGLMQVMGETARCNGFRGWFAELCVPEVGLEWGCLYVRRLADKYLEGHDWPRIMRAYNGGPGGRDNTASPYPGLILAHIPGGVWPATEVSHA